ncbi:MAG TPA: hypothetical protein DCY98_06770 [Nitrospinae bacterium]|nr:hypothetical protein [Nitrospinota bacterium]
MINKERIAKAKADILNVFQKIEEIISIEKSDFLADSKSPLALKYLLIEAVEAITEMCQHLLARAKGIPCEGYVDCIVKTGREGIITASLANKLRRLADLRNSFIHRYWIINDDQLYTQTIENKGDLIDFVNQIDAFIAAMENKEAGKEKGNETS